MKTDNSYLSHFGFDLPLGESIFTELSNNQEALVSLWVQFGAWLVLYNSSVVVDMGGWQDFHSGVKELIPRVLSIATPEQKTGR